MQEPDGSGQDKKTGAKNEPMLHCAQQEGETAAVEDMYAAAGASHFGAQLMDKRIEGQGGNVL